MAPQLDHFGSRFMARGTIVPGEAAAGDHLQAEYHLWLVGDQLSHGAAPWRDPYTFRPESPPRWNFGGWPFGLAFWPLDALFGHVRAWNLFLLLSYLAAGGFTYLWLRELSLPVAASALGGLVFALEPYRVAQSAGHLRGPISTLLPLSLWALERGRRGSPWWYVGSAAALASIPFSDVHLSLGAIPFFLLYALCRRAWAGAVAVVPAVVAGLLVGHFSTSGIGAGGRSLRQVAHYSATGLDFVTRHPRHGLESFVFLGWLVPLLALAGLVLLVLARRWWLVAVLAVGALVPVLLALGTHFPLYSTLWHHLAPLRYPRVPERLMPVACLCLAALVAFAAARLRWIFVALLVVLVAADLRVSIYDAAAASRGAAAYRGLRAPGRLLELPVLHPSVHLGSVYLWYDQFARRERPGGYSTIAPDAAALLSLRLAGLNCGDWRPGDDALLRRLGVSYVAFHRGLFGDTGWFAWRELLRHGFGQVKRDAGVTMLERGGVGGTSPVPEPTRRVVFCEGWKGASPRYTRAAFWAKGPVRLRLTARKPVRVAVTVDDRRVQEERLTHPAEARVGSSGWHLVGIDAASAANGLRVGVRP
ncbi:MAG TPA: hypothetical protein VFK62_11830 [Gaiellaceae bacterium]|nr:hypothetical protein [Gaiellaceae bacterium]